MPHGVSAHYHSHNRKYADPALPKVQEAAYRDSYCQIEPRYMVSPGFVFMIENHVPADDDHIHHAAYVSSEQIKMGNKKQRAYLIVWPINMCLRTRLWKAATKNTRAITPRAWINQKLKIKGLNITVYILLLFKQKRTRFNH
jgi:hypothetical protein